MVTAVGAFAVAFLISWAYEGGYSNITKKRFSFAVGLLAVTAVLAHAYIRHQWLRYVRESALKEMTTFVSRSQEFDNATSAGVGLVQEVELVSRGYRMFVRQAGPLGRRRANRAAEARLFPPSAGSRTGARCADASVCARR